jgi:outer membrane protein OmpA-like peptidoglycan-associated protein
MTAGAPYNAVVFYMREVGPDQQYYIGNLRLAIGAPDARNKLLKEGRWVTHGILFDVNSDRIRGESYGTLKEVASVLNENADLKLKVIGHTDSDGDDAANLALSKSRAESVKKALISEFGIAESRLQTDGMGESKPIDKNDSAVGKANNRRVEFIKS